MHAFNMTYLCCALRPPLTSLSEVESHAWILQQPCSLTLQVDLFGGGTDAQTAVHECKVRCVEPFA
jgi:hypothetical protein